MLYEVVYTQSYLDVGLCIERNDKFKPKRVLARASRYSKHINGSNDREYGGVEAITWINTGVFLSKDEWRNISYDKDTDQILRELGIEKKVYLENEKEYEDIIMEEKKINIVTVRWWDGYKEDFRVTEIRFGSDLLWMRLEDGNNRHIPLRMVRWFGTSIESHQNTGM